MTTKTNKVCKDINFRFFENDNVLETIVDFEDDTRIYIYVDRTEIFVCTFDYDELERRIDKDDIDSFEMYDTVDLCDYYMKSEYYEYINTSLLRIASYFFN